MPGSTDTSSAEQPKAKVTDSSVTNGVFVRPVAVAGIFRPAEESANKPPALPEKRRFSALSGDLRPSSGVTNDEFARRRQSWDTKTKEVPFGQGLLRRTPKNTSTSSLTPRQESATNGSSHEDISRDDASTSQKIDGKSLEKLNSVSETSDSNFKTSDTLLSVKGVPSVTDLSKKGKVQIVSKTIKEESKSINHFDAQIPKNVSKELSSGASGTKVASDSVSLSSISKVTSSVSEKSVSKSFLLDTTVIDKSSNSTDSSKPPKKVYGLIKRDSKPETSVKTDNTIIKRDSKSEIDSSKTDSVLLKKESQPETSSRTDIAVLKKESQPDISPKSDNLPEKVETSKVKKVYGLSKTNFKKETEVAQSKSVESSVVIKTSENNPASKSSENNKPQETNISSKSSETNVVSKLSETNVISKQFTSSVTKTASESNSVSSKESTVSKSSDGRPVSGPPKLADKIGEFQKAQSPPKDFRTVRRTSDVIAARIQNIFSNISAPEKPPPLLSRKTKIVEKSVTNVDSNSSKAVDNKNRSVDDSLNKAAESLSVSADTSVCRTADIKVTNADINLSKTADSKSASADNSISKTADRKSATADINVSKTSDSKCLSSDTNLSKSSDSKSANARINLSKGAAVDTALSKVPDSKSASADTTLSKPADSKNINTYTNLSKTANTNNIITHTSLSKTADSKNNNVEKLGAAQLTEPSIKTSIADSSKKETKLTTESKSEVKKSVAVKYMPVTEPDVTTVKKRSDGNVNKEESKYKQQNQTSADHSSLKKENKLASESSHVLQSNKTGEVVNTGEVKAEFPLKKADSKTEHSINATPSKAEDKKILNIGGRMPIKKQDQNSVEGVASLKTTNQDDRKSLDSTVPVRTVVQTTNKGQILKAETSSTCASSPQKIAKSVSSSYTVNTAVSDSSNLKNSQNIIQKFESSVSVKETSSSNSSFVPQTVVKTTSVQQSGSISTSSSEISQSQIKKLGNVSVGNGTVETSQVATKIEVAKITPATAPGIVPTVNVLFRTKSPQSSATKEENRKKVVVETYTSTSPVPSAVINASRVSENISVQSSSGANKSVKEALNSVENVQKSVSSPSLPKKHVIKNLKKEELSAVTLSPSDSLDTDSKMPPNTIKVSSDDSKIETNDHRKEEITTSEPVVTQMDKSSSQATISTESVKNADSRVSDATETIKTSLNITAETKEQNKSSDTNVPLRNSSTGKTDLEVGNRFTSETKMNVLDLGDWSKKFQLAEPEPPRVPLRRRALRDSMPPSSPLRSRFGSLKRIEDSSRYLPRSPSQSSLPLRYSYTEMLSKVCSMGVLPTIEPSMSKSCSSSSSQVSELWSELSEEQSTATHTAEMLEGETTERMRLEKEVQELQNRCSQVQIRSDKMEMEMMEARVYRTPELNGDLSEDEDPEGNSSLYKQKYERALRDMEIMKRRIQQQHEEEMEQKDMLKKVSDKRLAEALEDVEEERQVANQWKRKAQKLGSELQDLRLMLEEQMARNGELEKKQRRFDAELSAAQEEIKKERLLREKFAREKDQAMHEKYSLEQDLQSSRLDADTLHEKITQLNRELDELTLSSKGEEEVTQLKRAKQELERKCRDQEEELEELAAQVSMLEQAKLRLEMSLEKVRQEHRREASVREEEIEEIRASFSKKIKNLEAQLESEQDERHQLMKQKHELERRLYEMADQPPAQDPEIERRLRRDLKRTKALLRDAQSMLEHTREGQSGKTLIRQLKNQLEDSEFAKSAAVKARQAVEAELQECQTHLEEATRAKNEAESRCLQLSREKSAIQTQLEEAEEEMAEVMKKYKAVVAQMSIDQKTLSEQNQQIADLETEKQMLKDQLSEVSHKFEHLAGQSEDTHKVHRLDGKVRDLESKLELEQTTRSRLEHQIARLKEQNDRIREECDSLRNKELQAQEGVRRLQRQMRELREDYSALQQKEAEAYRKQHELEMALENTETDLQVTKNDLRLACQRIQDLQNALEDDLDSGTDVPDDSGSDSDESFELAMLRNQSVTPTQRCGSAASNYSFASEGFRSRTSSFTNELSAFSRMMLRRTSMDFLG